MRAAKGKGIHLIAGSQSAVRWRNGGDAERADRQSAL